MEADRAEAVHHRRPGERLGQEEHVGVGAPDLLEQPLPERHRLGVRVVDAEDPHAVRHPVPDDPQHLAADAGRVVVEVDRVDVLVLLRRVLGVGDGAVGAGGEPLAGGVVTHGWSGAACSARSSATSRPSSSARATNASKSSKVPRSGWIGVVAAVLAADRPRRPGVVGAGGEGVVGALAVDLADRVDRRQVDDVEAHRRRRRRAASAAVRKVPLVTLPVFGVAGRALGAREELVPAAEERPLAVGVRRVRALDGDAARAAGAACSTSTRSGSCSAASRASTGRLGVAGRLDRAADDAGRRRSCASRRAAAPARAAAGPR